MFQSRRHPALIAAAFAVSLVTPATAAVTTWDGLTINFDQSVSSNSIIEVYNGLTLNADLKLLNGVGSTLLSFVGSQTLGGTGSVVVDNGFSSNIHRIRAVDGTLTIGPSVTVRTGTGSVAVGNHINGSVINLGTISAQTAGKFVDVNPSITFTNNGALRASNNSTLYVRTLTGTLGDATATGGGTLDIDGAYTNDHDRTLADSSHLILRGTWTNNANISLNSASLSLYGNWNNAGAITAVDSTITLGGTFNTDNLGAFSRSGGAVLIAGTLDNTGRILTLDANTGSWRLNGGTILNGTLRTSGGAALLLSPNSVPNVVDNLTLEADVNVPDYTTLTAHHGLTIAAGNIVNLGTPVSSAYATLLFEGGGTLAGAGEVVFGAGTGSSGTLRSSGGGLTIAPSITVRTGTGYGTVGDAAVDLLNLGSIISGTPNRSINIEGAAVRNEGLWHVATGATLLVRGNWTNAGTIRVDNGSLLTLGGTFTPASIGTVIRNGTPAAIDVIGTIDNTGHNLSLTQSLGPWRLVGGTIKGGTIPAGAAPTFVPGVGGATAGVLDGVTATGNFTVPDRVSLTIRNGLTLAGGARVTLAALSTNFASLLFSGAQSLSGNGEILVDGAWNSSTYVYSSSGALTIGPGITVRTDVRGSTQVGVETQPIVLQGTLSARNQFANFYVTGSSVTNTGLIEARDAATVTLAGNWANSGSLIAADGGTLILAGSFSTSSLTGLSAANGNVLIAGNLNNAASTLTVSPSAGNIALANGGSVVGGNIVTTGGARLGVSGGATLNAVSLAGDAELLGGTLSFTNGASITSQGAVRTTVATSGTLHNLVNSGLVSAEHPNRSITLTGSWSNAGTLRAANGGIIILSGSTPVSSFGNTVAETGGVVAIAGALNLGGSILARSGAAASLGLAGGAAVSNGTLAATDGATFTATSAGQNGQLGTVTLSDVTLAGQFSVAGNTSLLSLTDLTLDNAHVSIADRGESPSGSDAKLLTTASQSITGIGAVTFDGTTGRNVVASSSGALTIGPGITIRTGSSSGTVGPSVSSGARTVVNHGLISAETPGQTLTLTGNNWSNLGTLRSANGATLNLAGVFTPASIGTLDVSGGGLVNVAGSVSLAGSTLTLSSTLPLGITTGGNISNGTIASADATILLARGPGATLTSATLNTPLSIQPSTGVTFTSSVANQPITVSGPSAFLRLAGGWTNNSSISATSGATLNLTGTPTSLGTIQVSDSTLNLGGPLTISQFRTIGLSNSTVLLSTGANLNITGDTLTLDAATGNIQLGGGRITGGTVSSLANRQLLANPATVSSLDAVTLSTNFSLGLGASVTLFNGLTLANNARISLINDATLSVSGPTPLAGNGEITFDGVAPLAPSGLVTFAGTPPRLAPTTLSTSAITLSPGITVRTNTSGGTVGGDTRPLVNQGLISAQTPTKTLTLLASALTNAGTLEAKNASTLTVSSTSFTNTGTITVDPTSTLLLSNTAASTPNGTIRLAGTALLNYTGSSPTVALRQQLAVGRNNITGIIAPNLDATPSSAIGYIEASTLLGLIGTQTATYAGQTIDATTLILKPTSHGDANLDGQITPDDYARLDKGYAMNLAGWVNGDFDYNNVVDANDYLLVDAAFLGQSTPSAAFLALRQSQFGDEYVSKLLTSVPEPGVALVGPMLSLLLTRSSRSRGRCGSGIPCKSSWTWPGCR